MHCALASVQPLPRRMRTAAGTCPLGMSTATSGGGFAAGFIICTQPGSGVGEVQQQGSHLPIHMAAPARAAVRCWPCPRLHVVVPVSLGPPPSLAYSPPASPAHLDDAVKGRAGGTLEGEAKHGIDYKVKAAGQRPASLRVGGGWGGVGWAGTDGVGSRGAAWHIHHTATARTGLQCLSGAAISQRPLGIPGWGHTASCRTTRRMAAAPPPRAPSLPHLTCTSSPVRKGSPSERHCVTSPSYSGLSVGLG